ncbi:hypothetical protein ACFCZR_06245 [Streptomyces rubiginosohelvolus]|uniref:hypothetical protein n=1 Tax=Streptomyces rubiginosohelvolus TaxID=67362 RepID=UPI0035D7A85E
MIRIEIEQDGEWVPVDGVRSVELHQTEPDPVPVVTWQTALRTATTVMAELIRRIEQASRAVQSTGLVDESGNVHRRDRPAWQSPYGPPHRRR